MKAIKFSKPLPELIMEGKKHTTWRVGDEKNIEIGDLLSLCDNDGVEFAKAEAVEVKDTIFGELTDIEKEGHEEFSSDEEMYTTYSKYYNMEVTPKTRVKVIKFRLIP